MTELSVWVNCHFKGFKEVYHAKRVKNNSITAWKNMFCFLYKIGSLGHLQYLQGKTIHNI